ncbi:MAG: anthranilate phosphoribosyltransferase [Acidobacteria bacterium]|nr:anthranilate phosphoribosyltransferase [Acidobacteriota bacterium]
MNEAIRHYTNEFRAGRDVSPYDAETLFDALINETEISRTAALLTAWAAKGATEDEIFRFARILRDRVKRIDTNGLACVDIVGTGGSSAKTFNVSTAAALVAAGAGLPVAKHGNRAATSSSGSADVLTHLGVEVDIEPAKAEEHLKVHGICFMFAPRHHSLSPALAEARKQVGKPTIFNCIGPLANPAFAEHQLIGVWNSRLLTPMAKALARLGTKRSWIINNADTLDEIGLDVKTDVMQIHNQGISKTTVDAREYGKEAIAGNGLRYDPAQSAALIEEILNSRTANAAAEKLVMINAAAAISLVTGEALSDSMQRAEESIRSKAALRKLDALRSSK